MTLNREQFLSKLLSKKGRRKLTAKQAAEQEALDARCIAMFERLAAMKRELTKGSGSNYAYWLEMRQATGLSVDEIMHMNSREVTRFAAAEIRRRRLADENAPPVGDPWALHCETQEAIKATHLDTAKAWKASHPDDPRDLATLKRASENYRAKRNRTRKSTGSPK